MTYEPLPPAPSRKGRGSKKHFLLPRRLREGAGGRGEGWGLANVVQQDAPGEGRRGAGGQLIEHQQGVRPHVAFGMELRRLLDALHARDFRQELRKKLRFVEQLKGAARGAFSEKFGQLVSNALD